MADKFVPTKYARTLLQVVEEEGYSVEQVLAKVGLAFNPLFDGPSTPEEIPARVYGKIYEQVMWLLQDESFGLHAAGVRPMGTFRMMCYCIINCSTLGQAVRRAREFDSILLANRGDEQMGRSRPNLTFENTDKTAVYGYIAEDPDPDMQYEKYVLGIASGLSMWHRFCGWLIDRQIELEEVCFTGTPPKNVDKYQHFFNCQLRFNQPQNAFKFSKEYLDYPVLQNEETLKAFLRNVPFQLIVMPNHGDSIISQIRSIIGHDFSRAFPSFEKITEVLNMSATTLRRRLRKEGATYQEIKDNSRRDAALSYLTRPELSITAVAALMGFNDPSSFHRSFKKWTGQTPKEYRDQMLRGED